MFTSFLDTIRADDCVLHVSAFKPRAACPFPVQQIIRHITKSTAAEAAGALAGVVHMISDQPKPRPVPAGDPSLVLSEIRAKAYIAPSGYPSLYTQLHTEPKMKPSALLSTAQH